MIPAPTNPLNGKTPLAPHEVAVDNSAGIPAIILTRMETGIPETYHLLPEAASALVSGLIGVTQPPPGEVWCVVKADPKAMRFDGRDVAVTVAGRIAGSADIDATLATLRERAIREIIRAQEAISGAKGDDDREAAHRRLWWAAEELAYVVDNPSGALHNHLNGSVRGVPSQS